MESMHRTGDIVIIPATVPHGWTEITDHVDYLSVRPDPDRVLPAGYVNPIIKKSECKILSRRQPVVFIA